MPSVVKTNGVHDSDADSELRARNVASAEKQKLNGSADHAHENGANGTNGTNGDAAAAAKPLKPWEVKKPRGTGITSYPPISTVIFLFELFFSPKFFVHRIVGLLYLIQWALAFFLYFYDYDKFLNSPLPWSLPLCGVMQAITATYTFTFLPKKSADTGYFSDLKVMSYQFVAENSFFAGILLFQWMYIRDDFYWNFFRPTIVFELAVVFLPYVFRQLWPRTRFRDSMNENFKSERNKMFYVIGVTITKAFYVWAKHYIGFFLNYVRYLDRLTPQQTYHIYLLEMFSGFATTIGMFLHTLKFKKYMGPRLSFFIYAGSYLMTFYTFISIYDIFLTNLDLVLVVLVGVLINFRGRALQYSYQVLVMAWFIANRYAPEMLPEKLVLRQGH